MVLYCINYSLVLKARQTIVTYIILFDCLRCIISLQTLTTGCILNIYLLQIAKSANGALRNLLSSSPPSRSTSPASSREYHGTDQFMPQPTDLWLDDFSLISSNDSRSRTSTCSPTAPMVRYVILL